MRTGRFEVEIDGVELPGFRTVNLPTRRSQESDYREGGGAKKTWGQPTFDDLSMERGLAPEENQLHDWRLALEQGRADEGRKEIGVKLLNEEGEPKIRWTFTDAWPTEYDPPNLDASADGEIATESITIAFDRMKRDEV
jgi:phage tail-like protein